MSEVTEPQVEEAVAAEPTEVATEVEEPVQESKDSLDWWNMETYGEKHPQEVLRDIQTGYNEKSTKLKTIEKNYQAKEQELSKKDQELQETVQSIRAALADPNVYRQYRTQLGYVDQVATTVEEAPKLDLTQVRDVTDLERVFKEQSSYFEKKLVDAERRAEAKFENRLKSATDPFIKDVWSKAITSRKEKYGDHWTPEIEAKVARAVSAGQYPFKSGDEKGALDRAFRGECPEAYESVIRANLLKESEAKKSKSIAPPKRTTPKIKKNLTGAEAVIARVNARIAR